MARFDALHLRRLDWRSRRPSRTRRRPLARPFRRRAASAHRPILGKTRTFWAGAAAPPQNDVRNLTPRLSAMYLDKVSGIYPIAHLSVATPRPCQAPTSPAPLRYANA